MVMKKMVKPSITCPLPHPNEASRGLTNRLNAYEPQPMHTSMNTNVAATR